MLDEGWKVLDSGGGRFEDHHQVDAVADMEETGGIARADLWPNQNKYGQLILPIDIGAGVIDQPVTDLGSMAFTLGTDG